METISNTRYEIQVGRDSLTLSLSGLTEEEALAVERVLKEINANKPKPLEVVAGQVWKSPNASAFHVLEIANRNGTIADYPVTVVYRNLDPTRPLHEVWVRPIREFLKGKELVNETYAQTLICQYYNRHNGPRYL